MVKPLADEYLDFDKLLDLGQAGLNMLGLKNVDLQKVIDNAPDQVLQAAKFFGTEIYKKVEKGVETGFQDMRFNMAEFLPKVRDIAQGIFKQMPESDGAALEFDTHWDGFEEDTDDVMKDEL